MCVLSSVFLSCHRRVEQVKHRIRRKHNKDKKTHVIYMDDVKVIDKSGKDFQKKRYKQLEILVKGSTWNSQFTCRYAKIVLRRGELFHSQNLVLEINRERRRFEQVKTQSHLTFRGFANLQICGIATKIKSP